MSRNFRPFGKTPSRNAVKAELHMWRTLYGYQDKTESQGGAAQGDGDCTGQENPGGTAESSKEEPR